LHFIVLLSKWLDSAEQQALNRIFVIWLVEVL